MKKVSLLQQLEKKIDKTFTISKIRKITDKGIQKILINYLSQEKFKETEKNGNINFKAEEAFSAEGLEDLNNNISTYNYGKAHKPIYKVRLYEQGNGRFPLGINYISSKKYAQGSPNLFFAIYNSLNGKFFETIPLNEVIFHQKDVSTLPKNERTKFVIKKFTIDKKGNQVEVNLEQMLSPLDLVYVPTDEEMDSLNLLDFKNLDKDQLERIFNVNDFSGVTCYFTPNRFAKSICPKEVDMRYNYKKKKTSGSFDSKTASLSDSPIKERCIKLRVDRLGNIIKA